MAGEVAPWAQSSKTGDLSLTPGTHLVKRKKQHVVL